MVRAYGRGGWRADGGRPSGIPLEAVTVGESGVARFTEVCPFEPMLFWARVDGEDRLLSKSPVP